MACTPPLVRGHGGLLEEALANLLDNALRYSPGGGRITVSVSVAGAWASVTVSDSGPGMPAHELPQAGTRFFRASNSQGGGSGLGLAIVHSIAKRHGAIFDLQHAPGEGGLVAQLRFAWDGEAPHASSGLACVA